MNRLLTTYLRDVSHGYVRLRKPTRHEVKIPGWSYWATDEEAKALRAAPCPRKNDATQPPAAGQPATAPAPQRVGASFPTPEPVQDLDCTSQ